MEVITRLAISVRIMMVCTELQGQHLVTPAASTVNLVFTCCNGVASFTSLKLTGACTVPSAYMSWRRKAYTDSLPRKVSGKQGMAPCMW